MFVNNPLLRSAMQIFTEGDIESTGAAIIYANQGMGKSVAGFAVLEAAEAGILFRGNGGGVPY